MLRRVVARATAAAAPALESIAYTRSIPGGSGMAEAAASPPWWVRAMRWRPTSAAEAASAERAMLNSLLSSHVEVRDVQIGPGQHDFLHTYTIAPGGDAPTAAAGAATPASTAPPAQQDASHAAGPGPGSAAVAAAAGAAVGQRAGAMPVVLLPGYGAASGFYFRVLDALASTRAFSLHAVDWLGTGLSGRPPFTAKGVDQAESFFTDSLAAWKDAAGLGGQKVVLVGHSLGGYLAAAYALRHPEHVAHLVLVCPAGVPKAPEDWQRKFLGAATGLRANLFKTAMWAWEKGVTPHAVIRTVGPWGPRLCERYVVGRFNHHGQGLSEHEASAFHKYFYHSIAGGRGSGEYALRHLLAPGAWAHEPLSARLRELKVPVTFIYGAHDWMRPQHAVDLCRDLKKERAPRVATDLHTEIIEDAGHFVFLDQPEAFSRALVDAVSPHLSREAEAVAAAALARIWRTGSNTDATSWDDTHSNGAQKPSPAGAAGTVGGDGGAARAAAAGQDGVAPRDTY